MPIILNECGASPPKEIVLESWKRVGSGLSEGGSKFVGGGGKGGSGGFISGGSVSPSSQSKSKNCLEPHL